MFFKNGLRKKKGTDLAYSSNFVFSSGILKAGGTFLRPEVARLAFIIMMYTILTMNMIKVIVVIILTKFYNSSSYENNHYYDNENM